MTATLRFSSLLISAAVASADCAAPPPPSGLRTHMRTNSPIMHIRRSASVKIHSGHSSQISSSSHLQDMVGGGET